MRRLPPGIDDRCHRRSGDDRLVGQIVQRLEIGVAQHQPIVGIPQHEGFGDGLDGVAQPHVRRGGLLDHRFLLGDVDGDAEQMQAESSGWRAVSQRTRSHTQCPPAWRMRKAWSIDWVRPSAIWMASS